MTDTVLVTGATGFIGVPLVHHLAGKGWRVIAAAREARSRVWPEGVTGRDMPGLGQPVDWAPVLEGATHVVHLAGLAHARATMPEGHYTAINAEAAGSLADAARTANIRRFVLMSSVRAQSGPVASSILDGSEAARPEDAYGRSKRAAEEKVAHALSGSSTDWVTLRPVLVYGPGVKGNMRLLMKLARLPLPLPLGALKGRRSILGVENLVDAVAHALIEPRCARRTFLVADNEPLSVPEIVAALRTGAHRKQGLFSLPNEVMEHCARLTGFAGAWERLTGDLVADTSALRATGWEPVDSTREALAALIREEIGKDKSRHQRR